MKVKKMCRCANKRKKFPQDFHLQPPPETRKTGRCPAFATMPIIGKWIATSRQVGIRDDEYPSLRAKRSNPCPLGVRLPERIAQNPVCLGFNHQSTPPFSRSTIHQTFVKYELLMR
jgi:hypothetical protein